ncbi:pentatricopeptide repeat-containing protein At3g16610-like [Coffea arabica]|uniref:Pentatricopeptide repeat-containing protein At3g16610-like n=1 Tax=Coffea arabica TaxID=13443 RepID=A0ABM4VQG2_COFAR
MVVIGAKPTKFTYPFVLKACAALEHIDNGVKIHDDVKRDWLASDVYISTALVDFYVKCGCLLEARQVFNEMPERDVAWNAMISGFSIHGMHGDLIHFALEMQEMGVSPNSSTLVTILPVIGEANEVIAGKAVHRLSVRRGIDSDVMMGTGRLDMNGKCGWLVYARRIFHAMTFRNVVTWSAMIGACIACDCTQESLELFEQMRVEDVGSLPPVTLATVFQDDATKFFEEMSFKDSVFLIVLLSLDVFKMEVQRKKHYMVGWEIFIMLG